MNEIELTKLQTGLMLLSFFGGIVCGIILAAVMVAKESGTKKRARPGELRDLEDKFVPREACSNCGTFYSRSFSKECPICKHYEIHN